jgi:hypothetical protein
MGDVIPFDYFSTQWPEDRAGLRKPDEAWRAIDLRGRRPAGHPGTADTSQGKVRLATSQVWVEYHTQRLFVITQLYFTQGPLYSYDVVFEEYGRGGPSEIYPDTVFRSQMQIWDEFDAERTATMVPWLRVVNESHEFSYSIYDEDGYRID